VFAYDSAGRVASVRDEVVAGGSLVSQFTLGYDSLDRIVEETSLPEPAPFAVTAAAMTYDDDDRLSGWNGLVTQSDADGNLTRGPLGGALATFAYDARNRITGVGTASFTYDAENRRISRTVAGTKTTFVHDPNAALSRLLQSTTGSTTSRYVYAGSLLLYAETGSALRVHHYDYRGSTVALTDGTGTVLGRVTYGSYGEIVARTGDTATEFLYNGRDGVVTDPNGLYYMRARYYSPEPRRFLNADPLGFAAGTNWYAFVGGSPVMSVDPLGLCKTDSERTIVGRVIIGADSATRLWVEDDPKSGTWLENIQNLTEKINRTLRDGYRVDVVMVGNLQELSNAVDSVPADAFLAVGLHRLHYRNDDGTVVPVPYSWPGEFEENRILRLGAIAQAPSYYTRDEVFDIVNRHPNNQIFFCGQPDFVGSEIRYVNRSVEAMLSTVSNKVSAYAK
jgi:RHS repeat-associated protein